MKAVVKPSWILFFSFTKIEHINAQKCILHVSYFVFTWKTNTVDIFWMEILSSFTFKKYNQISNFIEGSIFSLHQHKSYIYTAQWINWFTRIGCLVLFYTSWKLSTWFQSRFKVLVNHTFPQFINVNDFGMLLKKTLYFSISHFFSRGRYSVDFWFIEFLIGRIAVPPLPLWWRKKSTKLWQNIVKLRFFSPTGGSVAKSVHFPCN